MSLPNQPEDIRLSSFLLWVPLALGFLLLAWGIEQAAKKQTGLEDSGAQIPYTYVDAANYYSEVLMDRSGHYVFTGAINGEPVTFMVDTGATHVAIPETVAEKLGLAYGQEYKMRTANGIVKSRATLLKTVSVGNILLKEVEGAVLPSMQGDVILLGMSFISRLGMQQEKGKLTFIQPRLQ